MREGQPIASADAPLSLLSMLSRARASVCCAESSGLDRFSVPLPDSPDQRWRFSSSRKPESGAPVTIPAVRLLWIDDEVPGNLGSVRLLELELPGLQVDCAESGTKGLRLALARQYAAVVLDLKLPDMNGVAVLERMRVARLDIPVLVVSGWADTESTVKAMRLGATDVRDKPLMGDEFVDAVRAVLASNCRSGLGGLAEPQRRVGDERTGSPLSIREAARALTDEALSALDFIVLARSFRAAATQRESCLGADRRFPEPSHRRSIASPHMPAAEENRDVAAEIAAAIAADLARGSVPSEQEIAVRFDIRKSEVHAILKARTGADFREVRRALRVRPVIGEVAYSLEQIAQIAYRSGYEYPGQFDRDFGDTIGTSPRTFRGYFRSFRNLRGSPGSSGFVRPPARAPQLGGGPARRRVAFDESC